MAEHYIFRDEELGITLPYQGYTDDPNKVEEEMRRYLTVIHDLLPEDLDEIDCYLTIELNGSEVHLLQLINRIALAIYDSELIFGEEGILQSLEAERRDFYEHLIVALLNLDESITLGAFDLRRYIDNPYDQ